MKKFKVKFKNKYKKVTAAEINLVDEKGNIFLTVQPQKSEKIELNDIPIPFSIQTPQCTTSGDVKVGEDAIALKYSQSSYENKIRGKCCQLDVASITELQAVMYQSDNSESKSATGGGTVETGDDGLP